MKLQKQKLQKHISAQETCFTQDFVWGISHERSERLQFRVKQASRRKINVRLGGSATLLVYFMFNDSGFRKKCCRYLHHSSDRHFYCRLMMILQEPCKCFIMFHHLQISDMNSTKYFGMSLCTLELSVIFFAI